MRNKWNRPSFLLFIIFVIVAVTLAACSGSNNSGNTSSGGGGTAPAPQNNAGGDAGSKEDPIVLKMASVFPSPKKETEPKYLVTDKLAQLVEERTDGRVKIEIFYSNQLVSQNELMDALMMGMVDMANTSPYWGDVMPVQDFIWLPFAFNGPDHYLYLMNESEAGKIFNQTMEESGILVLNHWSSGYNGIISKDPIEKVEDMSGKSVRLSTGAWEPWFKEMGVAPANIAAAEQYQALSQGILDATIYPYYTVDGYKFYEVAKHITTPGILAPTASMNLVNLDKWNQIPAELQDIIMQTAKELEKENMEAVKKEHETVIQLAIEKGMTVHELSKEKIDAFKKSAQVAYDAFASHGEDTQRMLQALEESYEKFPN